MLTVFHFYREEFAYLMSMINGSSAFPSSGFSGPINGTSPLVRNGSFGSSRASTPSPTMGKGSRNTPEHNLQSIHVMSNLLMLQLEDCKCCQNWKCPI